MKSPFWVIVYLILLSVNVLANLLSLSVLAGATKILLMPFLFGFLFSSLSGRNTKLFLLTTTALFCSWLGDILLIFQEEIGSFFLFGLSAFLLAHFSYIADFWFSRNLNDSEKRWKGWLIVISILAIYMMLLFMKIGPGLNSFTIPIIFYAAAITGMFLSAFSRGGRTPVQSFGLVMLGAALFIISDSLIALNKFSEPFYAAGVWIMLTYGVAQLLIVRGLILHQLEGNKKKLP